MERRGTVVRILGIGHTNTGDRQRRVLRKMPSLAWFFVGIKLFDQSNNFWSTNYDRLIDSNCSKMQQRAALSWLEILRSREIEG